MCDYKRVHIRRKHLAYINEFSRKIKCEQNVFIIILLISLVFLSGKLDSKLYKIHIYFNFH